MKKFNQPFWHKPSNHNCGPLLHQYYVANIEAASVVPNIRYGNKIRVWIEGRMYTCNYREKIADKIMEALNNPGTRLIPFYIQTRHKGTRHFLSDSEELWNA